MSPAGGILGGPAATPFFDPASRPRRINGCQRVLTYTAADQEGRKTASSGYFCQGILYIIYIEVLTAFPHPSVPEKEDAFSGGKMIDRGEGEWYDAR